MKKVLILLPSFAGGGAERTITNLLNFEHSTSIEIKVLLLSKEGPYLEKVDDSHIISLTNRFFGFNILKQVHFFLFKYLPFCINHIKCYRPDVIMTVTESMNYLGYALRLSGITNKSKWIVRSGNNIFSEASSKGIINGKILHFLLKRTYQSANHIIAISQGIKKVIEERFGIQGAKISVIYNPIDIKSIQQLANQNSTSPFNQPYLLGIGRLANQKRFDRMIRLFAESGLANDSFLLVILGKGPQLANLQKLADDLGLHDHVIFAGFTKNPYYYLRYCKAFLLTSDWEGFAHVVAEALACNKPVIALDCEYGPSEILENGKFGFLLPKKDEDSFASLLKDKAFEDEKLFNGRVERANFFDTSQAVPSYHTLFVKL